MSCRAIVPLPPTGNVPADSGVKCTGHAPSAYAAIARAGAPCSIHSCGITLLTLLTIGHAVTEQDERQPEEVPAVVVQAGLASAATATGPVTGPEDED